MAHFPQLWLNSHSSTQLSQFWLNYHSYGSIITVMAQLSQLWLNYHSYGSVLAQFSQFSLNAYQVFSLFTSSIFVYCTTSSSTHVLLQVVQETRPKPIKIKYIIIKYIYKQCACLSQAFRWKFLSNGRKNETSFSVLAQFSPTISYLILCVLLVRFRVFSVQQFRFVAAINRFVDKLTNRQSDRICCAPVAV